MFGIYTKIKKYFSPEYKTSSVFGKIYQPIYNYSSNMDSTLPLIFNSKGERMDIFFLRDIHTAHHPYRYGSVPTKFLWDRYNFDLNTHFYSHNAMLETMGKPQKKYGSLIETRSIVPDDYRIFEKNKGLNNEFDAIFTYDEQILNSITNAKFVPWAAEPWFGSELGGGIIDENSYLKKSHNISFVCSNKILCELHKFRYDLAWKMKNTGKVDTFGTFDGRGGGYIKFIADTLTDYRYSFCIENEIQAYYFSERLTNCFLSMTVPIYIGASKIENFFNTDGIIQVTTKTDFENLIPTLCQKEYDSRKEAIIDNFNRVKKYMNVADYMFLEYL